jgi:hypothetical protein
VLFPLVDLTGFPLFSSTASDVVTLIFFLPFYQDLLLHNAVSRLNNHSAFVFLLVQLPSFSGSRVSINSATNPATGCDVHTNKEFGSGRVDIPELLETGPVAHIVFVLVSE